MTTPDLRADDFSTDDLAFETALDLLTQALAELESGELTLEESILLFERGMTLSQYCQTQLDTAELKVQQLTEAGALAEFSA
jgi:exodeoxyribonuclease VII small subunit